jgi:hypothetical protein
MNSTVLHEIQAGVRKEARRSRIPFRYEAVAFPVKAIRNRE